GVLRLCHRDDDQGLGNQLVCSSRNNWLSSLRALARFRSPADVDTVGTVLGLRSLSQSVAWNLPSVPDFRGIVARQLATGFQLSDVVSPRRGNSGVQHNRRPLDRSQLRSLPCLCPSAQQLRSRTLAW